MRADLWAERELAVWYKFEVIASRKGQALIANGLPNLCSTSTPKVERSSMLAQTCHFLQRRLQALSLAILFLHLQNQSMLVGIAPYDLVVQTVPLGTEASIELRSTHGIRRGRSDLGIHWTISELAQLLKQKWAGRCVARHASKGCTLACIVQTGLETKKQRSHH